MIKGIQSAKAAMIAQSTRQDITANNLANVQTTGFKRDRLFQTDLIDAQSGVENGGVLGLRQLQKVITDLSQGGLHPTSAPLDVALQGEGFFVVSDGQKTYYTRNGHFQLSAEGKLITAQGHAVQGEGGEILLPAGQVTIGSQGDIAVDGRTVGKLKVVALENTDDLVKVSGAMLVSRSGSAQEREAQGTIVQQGFVEASNVDAMREMVEMIAIMRNYQVSAKALQAEDETLLKTVTDIGRVP
ncbi:MAG: flagellar basal-body rod protein FlgF [Calditrichaeota bacterium]|nr:flagellar basal-body rod protein FlgF [Calditrichota bacterium]